MADQSTSEPLEPLAVTNLSGSSIEVSIPGMGELRIQRFFDPQTKAWGVSVVNDLQPGIALEVSQ